MAIARSTMSIEGARARARAHEDARDEDTNEAFADK